MKKIIASVLIVGFMAFILVAGGNTVQTKIIIESTDKYSRSEIESAIKVLKKDFISGFDGCTLKDIRFKEAESDKIVSDYLEYGGGKENGHIPENVIGFKTDFAVGMFYSNGPLEPNSTYEDYTWALVRDNKNSMWKVQECGY